MQNKVDDDYDCLQQILMMDHLDLDLDDNDDHGFDDTELEPNWNDDGFDTELDPDWNRTHVRSWEEHVVEALQIVRMHQMTEEDPGNYYLPLLTRFCKFNMAYFDLDKESRANRGPPIHTLTSHELYTKLSDSINIISFKILRSDMGYPINVFGTVLVRDQVDYKCMYLFKRDRDHPQVITSPEDMLNLTDPCRELAVTNGMFFEINLKIKSDDSGDIGLSKGVIEHDIFTCDKELKTRLLDSWHSSVQLTYTPVPCAVAANLAVNILEAPCDFFTGELIAWTSGNENQIILYDSEVEGTEISIGDGGSVALSRRLVAVPVNEDLVLRLCVREGGSEAACFEFTVDYLDDNITCCQGAYVLLVKVEWTAILYRTEKGVLRRVGDTLLVV